jgi:transposase
MERNRGAVVDGTTLLFGLPGVRVERVECLSGGTRMVHVVTDDPVAAACPSCGVVSTSRRGSAVTSPRDIPYGQDRIIVRWNKARWRCREDYCEPGSFTKAIEQVKRAGCGFRNRENSMRRIRFHCTRKQRAATQTSC